jgi:hypothetical protein
MPPADSSVQRSFRMVRSEAIIFTRLDAAVTMMDAGAGRDHEPNATAGGSRGVRPW